MTKWSALATTPRTARAPVVCHLCHVSKERVVSTNQWHSACVCVCGGGGGGGACVRARARVCVCVYERERAGAGCGLVFVCVCVGRQGAIRGYKARQS